MTERAGSPPWDRLRQLADSSALERRVHAMQWASELVSRHGGDEMPQFLRTAYRDMVAAVLLLLLTEQTSGLSSEEAGEEGRSVSTNQQVAPHPNHSHETSTGEQTYRSDDLQPAAIRSWARRKGIPVSDRGRIPLWIVNRYRDEHADLEAKDKSDDPTAGTPVPQLTVENLGYEHERPTGDQESHLAEAIDPVEEFFRILRGRGTSRT